MRVKSNEHSTVLHSYSIPNDILILLNRELIGFVVEADDQEGWVEVMEQDDRGEWKQSRKFGNVEILVKLHEGNTASIMKA